MEQKNTQKVHVRRNNRKSGQGKTADKTAPQKVTQRKKKINRAQKLMNVKEKRIQVITPYAVNTSNDYAVDVQTMMAPNALRVYIAAIASYVLQTGLGKGSERSNDMNFQTLWKGLNYMLTGIWSEITGGEVQLSSRPLMVHYLVRALINKSINAIGGKFSYSWWVENNIESLVTFSTGPTSYYTVSSSGTEPMYNDTNVASYTGGGTYEDYSVLLKYLDSLEIQFLKTVSSSLKSPLDKDVSCRARVYTYDGLDYSPGGLFSSIENEVPIWCPLYAKFVGYGNIDREDARIPSQLCLSTGDAATLSGLTLLGYHGDVNDAHSNRCPPRFLPVDFERLFTVLCLWMCKAKEAVMVSGGATDDIAFQPFSFTQQDFRIAFMQALKGSFVTTHATQFTGPLKYNESGNQFIPPTCGGNNYANVAWASQMMVPELFAENINSLKARAVKVKGGKHVAIYAPILGRWWQDIPGDFKIPGGEGNVPLFSTQSQEAINILDGSMGNQCVNLNNSYYAQVLAEWNDHVAAVAPVVTACRPLAGDNGPPGLPLILMCATEDKPAVGAVQGKRHRLNADKYLVNFEPVKQEIKQQITAGANMKGSKAPQVTYIPQATISELNERVLYTMIPNMDSELFALVDTLITPTIRLNTNEPGDVFNAQMLSVGNRFLNSIPLDDSLSIETQSVYLKLDRYANLMVPGIARTDSSTYTRLFSVLTDKGRAAGIFSTLAGIVGGFIPGLAPVANVIGSAIDGAIK